LKTGPGGITVNAKDARLAIAPSSSMKVIC